MADDHGRSETSHHAASPIATWLMHFFAGAFLGLMVAVAMAMLHNVSPFPALERAGADAAQRMFAYSTRAQPNRPVVSLIGLDSAKINAFLISGGDDEFETRLRHILTLAPSRLVLDVQFPEDAPSERAAQLLAVLDRVAAEHPAIPVIVAVPWWTAAGGHVLVTRTALPVRSPNIHMAVSLFEPDADGVVRRVRARICRTDPVGGWSAVQHLVAPPPPSAATTPAGTKPSPRDSGCVAGPEVPILFYAGSELLAPGSVTNGPLRYVPPGSEPSWDTVHDTIVVMGAIGPPAVGDRIRTPLGVMDGVLVEANAALTLADGAYVAAATRHGHGALVVLLWALFAAVSFAVLAPIAQGAVWMGPPRRRRMVALVAAAIVPPGLAGLILLSTGHQPDYPSLLLKVCTVVLAAGIFALRVFAPLMRPPFGMPMGLWRLLAFLCTAAAAVLAVLASSFFLAEWLLPGGWHIGSLLPAFAVLFEAVSEGLRPVAGAIHHEVERRFKPRPRPVILLPLVLLPGAAAAVQTARGAGQAAAVACSPADGLRRIDVESVRGDGQGERAGRAAPDAIRVSRDGRDPVPLGECRDLRPGDLLIVGHDVRVRLSHAAPKLETGPVILVVPALPMAGPPSALARFQAAVAEAVVPPSISPRLPMQAALSLPVGKKAPPGR